MNSVPKSLPARFYRSDMADDMKRKNIGSTFDSWLREEGLYEEVSATAIDRLLDPVNDAVTLGTLRKAAAAVGRDIRLGLV